MCRPRRFRSSLHKDGNDSEMTKQVRKFKEDIESRVTTPIFYQNEFLTSYEAEDRMKNSLQDTTLKSINPKSIA